MNRMCNAVLFELADKLGIEDRALQCIEEMSELTQALCKLRRKLKQDKTVKLSEEKIIENIAEEIADVEITVKQLKYLLCVTQDVEEVKYEKINKTKQLLEE